MVSPVQSAPGVVAHMWGLGLVSPGGGGDEGGESVVGVKPVPRGRANTDEGAALIADILSSSRHWKDLRHGGAQGKRKGNRGKDRGRWERAGAPDVISDPEKSRPHPLCWCGRDRLVLHVPVRGTVRCHGAHASPTGPFRLQGAPRDVCVSPALCEPCRRGEGNARD